MNKSLILAPATPSELLIHIITYYSWPTTIIIASAKQPFLDALNLEVQTQDETQQNRLLHKTLLQTAISRHIRLVFTPTVTHLRAYLATYSRKSKVQAPPRLTTNSNWGPLLLVYGFLEVHRLSSEWSAQGIANSASALIEAAAGAALTAAVIEPRGGGDGFDTLEEFLSEQIPVLSGAVRKDSGAWSGRTVDTKRVLNRWFTTDHDNNIIR